MGWGGVGCGGREALPEGIPCLGVPCLGSSKTQAGDAPLGSWAPGLLANRLRSSVLAVSSMQLAALRQAKQVIASTAFKITCADDLKVGDFLIICCMISSLCAELGWTAEVQVYGDQLWAQFCRLCTLLWRLGAQGLVPHPSERCTSSRILCHCARRACGASARSPPPGSTSTAAQVVPADGIGCAKRVGACVPQ